MPQVTVFKGELVLNGMSSAYNNEEFFTIRKNIYAETKGALLDAMVEESVKMAEQVEIYIITHKPEGYLMSDDYWYFSMIRPELLNEDWQEDFGSGGTETSPMSIVRSASHSRYLDISSAVRAIERARKAETNDYSYPSEDTNFYSAHSSDDVETIAKAGMSGAEFDELYKEAVEDGMVAKIRAERSMSRHYNEIMRRQQVRAMKAERKAEEKKNAPKTKKTFFNIFSRS